MLEQLSDRGPDSAGVAFYRDPAPPGWCKVSLYSPSPTPDWEALGRRARGRVRRGVSRPRVRATHAVFVVDAEAEDAQAWLLSTIPSCALMSAGALDRDLQGGGSARRDFVERFALHEIAGSHALGHTRMATESRVTTAALAPVLDRPRSVPGPQRLALEPQPPAPHAAARGHRVPDRERHRGRGRLPDVAAARGRVAGGGARRLPGRTWTASTRSRSVPPTGSRCCATRSRASRP